MAKENKVYKTCPQCYEGFSMPHGGIPIPKHECKPLFIEKGDEVVANSENKELPPPGFPGEHKHGQN